MWKYLVPRIALGDVRPMFGAAIIGGLLAGVYGIAHDQITYTISPEYFTNLKFKQFHYADFGLGDRAFVSVIGFLATWWVGFIVAWFLARRLIPGHPRPLAYRQISAGFAIVFACTLISFGLGFAYGWWCGPEADYSAWAGTLLRFDITDDWAFIRVAYIHNAGYLGGLVGLVVALMVLRPRRSPALKPCAPASAP